MAKKLNTIAIVEDSPADLTMVTDFLKSYTNKIKGFATGDSCINELVRQTIAEPDLILIDYFLDNSFAAKYDGLDTLVKVKELCPNCCAIMFTSVENARVIQLAKQKGAYAYIIKGVDAFDKLEQVIKSYFLIH